MVQVLEGVPSFGQSFARTLSAGLTSGISDASKIAQQLMIKKAQTQQKADLYNSLRGSQSSISGAGSIGSKQKNIANEFLGSSSPELEEAFANAVQQLEDPSSGRYLSPKELGEVWNHVKKSGGGNPEEPSQNHFQEAEVLSLVDPKLGAVAMKKAEMEAAPYKEFQKLDVQRGQEFFKGLDKERDSLMRKDQAIDTFKRAFESGEDISAWGPDHWARLTGVDAFRTMSGAMFENAKKEFLLANIGAVGSRPNQWIEQQISYMLPKIGQTNEANKAVVSLLETETNLMKQKIKIADDLEGLYRSKGIPPPGNASSIVDKAMQPIYKQEQAKLGFKLKQIQEDSMDMSQLLKTGNKKVPKGTPLTLKMAKAFIEKYGEKALVTAKDLGYTIPTEEETKSYLGEEE